jgi:hypothetical protein
MGGVQSNEAGSGLVSITVLSVTPLRAGSLFALASVEIDINGVRIEMRGIRARNAGVKRSGEGDQRAEPGDNRSPADLREQLQAARCRTLLPRLARASACWAIDRSEADRPGEIAELTDAELDAEMMAYLVELGIGEQQGAGAARGAPRYSAELIGIDAAGRRRAIAEPILIACDETLAISLGLPR